MNPNTIPVWDLPTRLFHWLLAGSFTVAYLTAEADGWENIHFTAGFTLLGLVVFRIVWGLVGSRHARFSSFLFSKVQMLAYGRSLLSSRPEHHTGHNPLGSVAVFLLLGLSFATAACGALMYWTGSELLEEPHELFANLMLTVVLVHTGGVFISSKLHQENLARAMVTGHKQGDPSEAIGSTHPLIAAAVLAAVLGFWGYSWLHPFNAGRMEEQEEQHHDDDADGD